MPLALYRELDLTEPGFGVEPEITAKLLQRHIRPYEVPITYRARGAGGQETHVARRRAGVVDLDEDPVHHAACRVERAPQPAPEGHWFCEDGVLAYAAAPAGKGGPGWGCWIDGRGIVSDTEVSSARSPGLAYMPALDGIRALAVLAVMAYHGGLSFLPAGFFGVDAFFVLSGFLITTLLVTEWARPKAIALARSGRAGPGACCRRCS